MELRSQIVRSTVLSVVSLAAAAGITLGAVAAAGPASADGIGPCGTRPPGQNR